MMAQSIRTRMALASVLPVLLVVLTIVSIFWQGRAQDLEASHQQRLGLQAHQVALFSAYGLFVGNTASLQNVVQDMQREPEVRAVLVFDSEGRLVASAGRSALRSYADLGAPAYRAQQRTLGVDVQVEAIRPAEVPIEDLFSQSRAVPAPAETLLGHVVIEASRQALEQKKQEALWAAIWVGLGGILVGGVLAYRLGHHVVGPLMRISQMVQRIGRGNFAIEPVVADGDPLQELQSSLNRMAKRLAWSRDDLERQVQSVTQELRLKKEEAERATLAKSRFLAAASHDLRQPSHALGMFVARLGQLPMDAQMRQLVDNLELSVQAMQDLLDSLLDLSRLDSGKVPVRVDAVDLQELLDSVRSTVETMAEAKGLRLRLRPTRHWALSDGPLLQRMLLNLVINAIRYTEHGSVLVACRTHGAEELRIEVWDSGIGIAPAHHEDIFKEFYQLPSESGDRNLGLGLGLNIVQRSAALLGHRITLRSEPGCGTRFAIVLPRAPVAGGPRALAAPSLVGDVQGLRVLLIEDNAGAREAVRLLLQSWGCTVQEASSCVQALQALEDQGAPDVIVSDYHLGAGPNGIACIAALRAQAEAKIPACLMSGDTDEAFLQAVQAADLPLLHKPVRPAKLRSLLRRLA